MKVILLQKVSDLGDADEIKDVADGYARNFLFPRHLAVPATAPAVGDLETRQKRQVKEAEHELHEQQALADRIDGYEVEIKQKVSEKGLLYAAVTPHKVAEQLNKLGFPVIKEQLAMKPIKEPGSYPVTVKFRHGLEAEIVVVVVATK